MKRSLWKSFRLPLLAGVMSFVIGLVVEPLGWPWWLMVVVQIGGALLVMFGVAAVLDGRAWRVRAEHEALMEQPMTLNEDGQLIVPVLGPGESVHVAGYTTEDGEQRILAAQVVRADGTTRLQSDWSERHR